MMRKSTHLQLKVGMFINIGLILFVIAVLALSGARGLFSEKSTYYVRSPGAEGLLPGANVLLAGVPVGTVSSLDLMASDPPVRISLSVLEKHAKMIRQGTTAEIATEGLVGERIVVLRPGDSSKPVVPPGQSILFRRSTNLNDLMAMADELAATGTRTAQSLGALAAKLEKSVEPERIDRVLGNLEQILVKINRGSGTLSGLINDPMLYDDAKALLGQANENRIVRNLVRRALRKAQQNRSPAERARESNSK